MTTPFDGKMFWWHFRPTSVGAAIHDPRDLACITRARTPGVSGVIAKAVHGASWEGGAGYLAIAGPRSVAVWQAALEDFGLELHLWAVPHGLDPKAEAAVAAEAASVAGVRSLILDVEPYLGFWEGNADDARAYMTALRAGLPDDFHIGISVDARSASKLALINFIDWMDTDRIGSVHPQCYWHDEGLEPALSIHTSMTALVHAGIPASIICPVLGTYPSSRRGTPVPPAELLEAFDFTNTVGGGGGSLFRLGRECWTADICGAVNRAWPGAAP